MEKTVAILIKLEVLGDKKGIASYHIESPLELQEEWFVGKKHVGITAGTSTPFNVIDSVHEAVRDLTDVEKNPS